MFYYLFGRAEIVDNNAIAIDCDGVGYLVYTSSNTIAKLSENQLVKVYTYASIREDAFDIYGFLSQDELKCFKMLIGVSGVGPKAAISLLSAMSLDEFIGALSGGNYKTLMQAQGIGVKIAQRIVLELKDKIKSSISDNSELFDEPEKGNKLSEARSALISLGYSAAQAGEALKGVDMASATIEDAIKQALKQLMR